MKTTTIKIEVSHKIYDKLMWLFSQFKTSELKVIEEKQNVKKYLDTQLASIDSNKAEYVSLDELDNLLEESVAKYEN